jgi:ribose 5-phosphate isomerase B
MFKGMVVLASDHAGFELKKFIIQKLVEQNILMCDIGPFELDPQDDYPDFIKPAAVKVIESSENKGIIFGKSGEGEAMAANRLKGVRAAVFNGSDYEIVRLAREHNNANILSIGAGFVTPEHAWNAVSIFLETAFSGDERHVRRNNKLDD